MQPWTVGTHSPKPHSFSTLNERQSASQFEAYRRKTLRKATVGTNVEKTFDGHTTVGKPVDTCSGQSKTLDADRVEKLTEIAIIENLDPVAETLEEFIISKFFIPLGFSKSRALSSPSIT